MSEPQRPSLVSPELQDLERSQDSAALMLSRLASACLEDLQATIGHLVQIEHQAARLDLSRLQPEIVTLVPELRIACLKATSQLQGLMTIAAIAKLVSNLASDPQ